MNTLKVIFCLLVMTSLAIAQPEGIDTLWTRYVGPLQDNSEASVSWADTTSNNGFVICGDHHIFALDSLCNEVWHVSYPHYERCYIRYILTVGDSGYVAVGMGAYTGLPEYDKTFFTRISTDGVILLDTLYSYSNDDEANCIVQDGNQLVVTGETRMNDLPHVFLMNLTYAGDVVDFTIPLEDNPGDGRRIDILEDSGLIIVGQSHGQQGEQTSPMAAKITSTGDVEWVEYYGGDYHDVAWDMVLTDDNSLILVGETQSYGDLSQNCYLLGVDSTGDEQWHDDFGYEYDGEELRSVSLIQENEYVTTGTAWGNLYCCKIDGMGNELWSFSGEDIVQGEGRVVLTHPDNTFTVLSNIQMHGDDTIALMKFGQPPSADIYLPVIYHDFGWCLVDSSQNWFLPVGNTGNAELIIDSVVWNSPGFEIMFSSPMAISPDTQDSILIQFIPTEHTSYTDQVYLYSNDPDEPHRIVYLEGLGTNTATPESPDEQPISFRVSSVFPNPFNTTTTLQVSTSRTGEVDISVFNIKGQLITWLYKSVMNEGDHIVQWDAGDVANGIYIIRAHFEDQVVVQKALLVK